VRTAQGRSRSGPRNLPPRCVVAIKARPRSAGGTGAAAGNERWDPPCRIAHQSTQAPPHLSNAVNALDIICHRGDRGTVFRANQVKRFVTGPLVRPSVGIVQRRGETSARLRWHVLLVQPGADRVWVIGDDVPRYKAADGFPDGCDHALTLRACNSCSQRSQYLSFDAPTTRIGAGEYSHHRLDRLAPFPVTGAYL
jgi:hypothetical protein